MPVDQVIRPFERDVAKPFGLERADRGDAHGERQSGEETGALLEFPAQREREAAARDRGPRAAAPAAPGRLPFGRERHAVHVATLRPAHELGRGRLDLVDDLDREGQRNGLGLRHLGQPAADFLGVDEIGGFEQPIATALHPFEGEARAFGVLEDLGNPRPSQADFVGQILAGMEFSIGKLAQQRESKRSEHLLTFVGDEGGILHDGGSGRQPGGSANRRRIWG